MTKGSLRSMFRQTFFGREQGLLSQWTACTLACREGETCCPCHCSCQLGVCRAEAGRPRAGAGLCVLPCMPSGAPSMTVFHVFQGLPKRRSHEKGWLGAVRTAGCSSGCQGRTHTLLLSVISSQETLIFRAACMCSLTILFPLRLQRGIISLT